MINLKRLFNKRWALWSVFGLGTAVSAYAQAPTAWVYQPTDWIYSNDGTGAGANSTNDGSTFEYTLNPTASGTTGQVNGMWNKTPVDFTGDFQVEFEFMFKSNTGNQPATTQDNKNDGFAISFFGLDDGTVDASDGSAIGNGGGALGSFTWGGTWAGSGSTAGYGAPTGLTVELDMASGLTTGSDPAFDPSLEEHISVYSTKYGGRTLQGPAPVAPTGTSVTTGSYGGTLRDGNFHKVTIDFTAATNVLTVSIDGTPRYTSNALNLGDIFHTWDTGRFAADGSQAMWGITGGNDPATVANQEEIVLRWPTPPCPTLVKSPTDKTVCDADDTGMGLTISGATPDSYEWYIGTPSTGTLVSNGGAYADATTDSLKITAANALDGNTYYAIIKKTGCPDVSTTAATLTVNDVPTITTQPTDVYACKGTAESNSVVATSPNSLAMTYQWKFNTTNMSDGTLPGTIPTTVSGATSANLNYTAGSAVTNGTYTLAVDVTNTCGTTASNDVTLTVNGAPIIDFAFSGSDNCAGTLVDLYTELTTAPTLDTVAWLMYQTQGTGSAALVGSEKNSNNQGYTYQIPSFSASDSGTYEIQVSNRCGSDNSSAQLTLRPEPTITTQPAANSTPCAGTNLTLYVETTDAVSYQWKKGGTNITGATDSTLTLSSVTTTDNGIYTVDVVNSCNTVTSSNAVVAVGAAPSISAQPTAASICVDGTAQTTFSVTATNATSYQWKKGGTNISGATSATYTINPVALADSGDYSVEVIGACSNVTSDTVMLTTNELPTISDPTTIAQLCEGEKANFSTTLNNNAYGVSYQWKRAGVNMSTGTGTNSTDVEFDVAVADQGVAYTVEATNTCGTATSNSATITTVNPNVNVSSAPTDVTTCEGLTSTFTVTATGASTYTWKKGATTVLTGPTESSLSFTSTAVSDGGTYTLEIEGSDPTCSPYTKDVQLTVNDTVESVALAIGGDAGPNVTLCDGGNLSIDATAVGGSGLNYTFTNLRTSTIVQPASGANSYTKSSITEADSGQYEVEVTSSCAPTAKDTIRVIVIGTPNKPVISGPTSACPGSQLTYKVTTPQSGVSYDWVDAPGFGASVNVENADSVMYDIATRANTGSVTVTASVPGCPAGSVTSDPFSYTITNADASATDFTTYICDQGTTTSATLSVTDAGFGTTPTNYDWWDGQDTTTATKLGSDAAYTSTTGETVYLYYEKNGCTFGSLKYTVTQFTMPDLTGTTPQKMCGNTMSITVTDNNNISNPKTIWTQGSTTLEQGSGLNAYTADAVGTYTATVTNVADVNLICASTFDITLTVGPSLTTPASPASACNGDTVDITVPAVAAWNGVGTIEYFEADGVTTTDGKITTAGTNVYVVQVTDPDCPTPLKENVTVTIEAPDSTTFDPEEDIDYSSSCATIDGELTFSNLDFTPTSYQWDYNGTSATDMDPTYAYADGGVFSVTLTFNPGSCKQQIFTKDMTIKPFAECAVTAPNAITPNGDGINDFWYVENIENYPNANVQIFNRWGELIHTETGYDQDWAGTARNGGNLEEGTYFYIIDLGSDYGVLKGTITVIRP